jgi:hypothetical protein
MVLSKNAQLNKPSLGLVVRGGSLHVVLMDEGWHVTRSLILVMRESDDADVLCDTKSVEQLDAQRFQSLGKRTNPFLFSIHD